MSVNHCVCPAKCKMGVNSGLILIGSSAKWVGGIVQGYRNVETAYVIANWALAVVILSSLSFCHLVIKIRGIWG